MLPLISRHWKKLLLLLLVFSPALFTAHLVWTKAVDVANWDEWENAPLLAKWHDGTLGWHDLYAAQIQHRIVVPRLITIALAEMSGGDFRWNVYACCALTMLNAALLWSMLRRTMPGSPWRWPLMFAMNLLLFCPMHYESLLWGSSMWSGVVMPCALAALLVLTAPPEPPATQCTARGSWTRFAIALLLAETATHSFAHGIALWPVLLLVLLVNPALGPLRTRLVQGGIWIVAAGLTLWAYFTNFINVAFHAYTLKPGDHALKDASNLFEGDHLRQAWEFFKGFMGAWFSRSPFVEHPLEGAQALGAVTLVLAALVIAGALLPGENRRRHPVLLPWLGLAAYVLVVGLMVSKRAADTGVHRAVMTRYLALNQYALVTLLALTALVGTPLLTMAWRRIQRLRAAAQDATLPAGVSTVLAAVLLTAFCTAQLPLWEYGLHLTEVWHRGRKQGQALMLLLPHLQDQKKLISMKPLCKSFDYCLEQIQTLQRIGLMHTPPLKSAELKWFTTEPKSLSLERAAVTGTKFRDDGIVELTGHARFGAGAPADLILVVQQGHILGVGQPAPKHLLRIYSLDYDVANVEDVPVSAMYPWLGQINPALIPQPAAPLELWALDVQTRKVTRLSQNLLLDPTTRRVDVTPAR